jgi:hypothetical protein
MKGQEKKIEEADQRQKKRQKRGSTCSKHPLYLTPGPSTTYYSANGASRTTPWSLKANDDKT